MLLTLSSDPRVWMGGRIPTRWRRYDRDRWENRLSLQIACSSLSNLVQKSSFLDTCSKKYKQAVGFKVVQSGAVVETCISMLRQWKGKSDEFPCFLQESSLPKASRTGLKTGVLHAMLL